MYDNKIIPLYFSAIALIISILVCVIKRVSPLTALFRIIPAIICFYILGFCFLKVLAGIEKDTAKTREEGKHTAPEQKRQKDDGEFEELKFTVIDSSKED